MNKRQARLFALVSTGIAIFAFLALTVHSHTKFDELTNRKNNTPQVQSGRDRHPGGYLSAVFGEHQYTVLHRPELLPSALLGWLRRLVQG